MGFVTTVEGTSSNVYLNEDQYNTSAPKTPRIYERDEIPELSKRMLLKNKIQLYNIYRIKISGLMSALFIKVGPKV